MTLAFPLKIYAVAFIDVSPVQPVWREVGEADPGQRFVSFDLSI
jgi:hypothetical protein